MQKNVKVGDTFSTLKSGYAVVMEYKSPKEILVKFITTGAIKIISEHSIESGTVIDDYMPRIFGKGFLGRGTYRTRKSGARTKEYAVWYSMLDRCYRGIKETYRDCYVCEDWHNFQNFAAWYNEQPNAHKKGFDLDKDIIKKGNKVYCPEYCDLVPSRLNCLLLTSKKIRGNEPCGVFYQKFNKTFLAHCKVDGVPTRIGVFNNKDDAFAAYKNFKEEYIKHVAMFYAQYIKEETLSSLLNWKVEIDD